MDTSTIAATGPDIRSLVKETEVAASPIAVWEAWASNEGIASWWAPAASDIELRIGGPYEILFSLEQPEGERGSEGCRVLAYVPGESLSFTWNAPPQLPLRTAHTWVVLTFTAAMPEATSGTRAMPEATSGTRAMPEATSVRLVHTGFLDGPDWDDYMAYFDAAWSYVLELLREHWS